MIDWDPFKMQQFYTDEFLFYILYQVLICFLTMLSAILLFFMLSLVTMTIMTIFLHLVMFYRIKLIFLLKRNMLDCFFKRKGYIRRNKIHLLEKERLYYHISIFLIRQSHLSFRRNVLMKYLSSQFLAQVPSQICTDSVCALLAVMCVLGTCLSD